MNRSISNFTYVSTQTLQNVFPNEERKEASAPQVVRQDALKNVPVHNKREKPSGKKRDT
jgi:hypothetical protein